MNIAFKTPVSDRLFDVVNTILQIFIFCLMVYPLYYIVIASFSQPNLAMTGKVLFWIKGFQIESYKRVFSSSDVMRGYLNTIFYTVLGTSVNLFVTLPCAYSLGRKDFRGRYLLTFFFSFTMFFSGGLIPTYMVVRNLKMLNTIWALIVPGAVSVWNMIICRNFFEHNIPPELLEVSRIDGCRNARFFFSIVLPLSSALIAVMTLFFAVGHWNSYFSALMYLNNKALYPLQLVLRGMLLSSTLADPTMSQLVEQPGFEFLVEQMKYALIVVSSVPVLILYPFVQKHFVQGVMIGAIKG